MGAATPTLGYRSKTAAVLAMREERLSTAAIASRIGVEPKVVTRLERSAKYARSLAAAGYKTIWFPPDLLARLAAFAAHRGVTARILVRQIIEVTLDDNLIGAILDDDRN